MSHLLRVPLLKTLSIGYSAYRQRILSPLLSNSSSSPLQTLAILNCILSEDFMKGLIQFISGRKNTNTSTYIDRVLICDGGGVFPSDTSIGRSKGCVKFVDTWVEH